MFSARFFATLMLPTALALLGACSSETHPPPLQVSPATTSGGATTSSTGSGAPPLCDCVASRGDVACNDCFVAASLDACKDEYTQCAVTPGCVAIEDCLAACNYAAECLDGCFARHLDTVIWPVFEGLMDCVCGRCSECAVVEDVVCATSSGTGGGGGAGGAGSGGAGGAGSGGAGGAGSGGAGGS